MKTRPNQVITDTPLSLRPFLPLVRPATQAIIKEGKQFLKELFLRILKHEIQLFVLLKSMLLPHRWALHVQISVVVERKAPFYFKVSTS